MKEKICRFCKDSKPITEFYKCPGGKYDVGTECKPCATIRHREYMSKCEGREIRASTSKLYARALLEQGKKYCPQCKEVLNLERFSTQRSQHSGGRSVYCRACARERGRQRQTRPEVKEKAHQYYVERRQQRRIDKIFREFGLMAEDYQRMCAEQQDKCAICGRYPTNGGNNKDKSLAIDHDHANDKIRGLLCTRCNPGLGFFQDDPDSLRKAADYIEYWRKKHGIPPH